MRWIFEAVTGPVMALGWAFLMWWQFKAGFARKMGYLLAAFLVALILGHRAHATVCYVWSDGFGGTFGDPASAAASRAPQTGQYPVVSSCATGVDCSQTSLGSFSCTVTGSAPASATCTASYISTYHYTNGDTDPPINGTATVSVGQVVGPCAPQCSANQDKHYMIPSPTGSPITSGTSACGSDGCNYQMDSAAGVFTPDGTTLSDPYTTVQSSHGPVGMQSAMNLGTTCASSGTTAVTPGPQVSSGVPATMCQSASGNIICDTQTAGGKNCGTFNGDAVCVADVPAGGCVTYASGGVACSYAAGASAVQTPPAPDNGTAGVPAIPDATVTSSAGTTQYFGAAKVAASTNPVTTVGTGSTGSTTGTGAAGIVSGGPAPCPPGQTCTGVSDSTSGGGDCALPPVCSDTDPVLCGIQNQAWLLRCESPTEAQVASAIGTVGTIPVVNGGDFSSAVGETGIIVGGAGSCPAPVTLTIMGRSLSLDIWSQLCAFAGLVSAIIMVVAYAVSARIMYVAVSGGSTTEISGGA